MIISDIASVASIIGVIIALWQSYSAKSKAKVAFETVNSMLDKKQINIYADIIDYGYKVENELNTQRGKEKPEFGSRIDSAKRTIDPFISVVNTNKHNFKNDKLSRVDNNLNIINSCRKKFDDNSSFFNNIIEDIIRSTQEIIAIAAEEKQNKEFKP